MALTVPPTLVAYPATDGVLFPSFILTLDILPAVFIVNGPI